jgi:hypothetical protein
LNIPGDYLSWFLGAYQGNAHEVVEPLISELLFLDDRERPHHVNTKMHAEEKTANGKLLDLMFDGYWEDFQPDL